MDSDISHNEKVVDQRSSLYAFTSLSQLKKYFTQYYSREEIEDVIEASKENFIVRRNTGKKETQLQFIRKCEVQLLSRMRATET